MKQERIDIASPEIAIGVHVSMNMAYYQAILRALEVAAAAHHLRLYDLECHGEMPDSITPSPEVMSSMARTVNRLRHLWLSPQVDKEILDIRLEIDADEGHDHVWLTGLLGALAEQGIVLAPSISGSEGIPNEDIFLLNELVATCDVSELPDDFSFLDNLPPWTKSWSAAGTREKGDFDVVE
jgi:hypothetical protein